MSDRTLASTGPVTGQDFDAQLAQIDAATDREAWRAARSLCLEATPANAAERWRIDVRLTMLGPDSAQARLDGPRIDEQRQELLRLADSPDAHPDDAERAVLHALALDRMRRRHDVDLAALDAAEARFGISARSRAQRGYALMEMDEREAAAVLLQEAITTHPDHRVDLAYAQLLYVVGDFDGAERHARKVVGSRSELDAWELLTAIAASRGDLDAELSAVTSAIEHAPGSDNLGAYLVHRAMVSAALDQADDARKDLERALESDDGHFGEGFVDYVRSRLDALDAAGPETRHRRLEAFPTVVQKWNYCGPAVIELCLRYLGLEMTQDIVAEAVKQEEGTPMLSIVQFLREQGMEVRRVEATPERVKAAIDAGIPVIMEDDYSNTLHVSVAVGYDDRLGILIVADPMTHAPRRQGVEARRSLASEQSYSAVAVLGRVEDVTDDVRRALDEAGLVESAPIALLDEIARKHPGAVPALVEVGPLEAAGLAAEALASKPSLARAAVLRASALTQASRVEPGELAAIVARYRTQFPQVAEFAAVAAEASARLGAPAHAIVEQVLATALDPVDARPHIDLAFGLTYWGERALAYRHANLAFVRAPANPHATLALARVVVDDLMAQARHTGELGAMRAAFLGSDDEGKDVPIGLDEPTLRTLAAHLVGAARDMAPQDANALVLQGDWDALNGDTAGAVAWYDRARQEAPDWHIPHVRHVFALDAAKDPAALASAMELVARGNLPDEAWHVLIRHVGRIGDGAVALTALEAALDVGVERDGAVRAVYPAVERSTGSQAAAARALVALADARESDADLLYAVVGVLGRQMTSGHAIDLLRARVLAAPDDARARVELAQLIGDTPDYRQEATRLLEQARSLAPWADVLTLALGWHVLLEDPARALQLADSVLETTFTSFELRRQALHGLGRTAEAQQVEAMLAAYAGSPERADMLAVLDHAGASRHGHAARLAVLCEPEWSDPDDVRNWVWASFFGRSSPVFSELIAAHPEIIDAPAVAEVVAQTGSSIGRELYAEACRRAAAFADEPGAALRLEILARTTLGELEGIGALAGDNIEALVALAEHMPNLSDRLTYAKRAAQLAPSDRRVLVALHAGLQDSGDKAGAIKTARRLLDDYPFDHQGAERVAEVEAYWGDLDQAVRWAAVAVSEAPYCTRALSAQALAAALTGDWEMVARCTDDVLRRSRESVEDRLSEMSSIIAAAAARDRVAYDAAVAASRAEAPMSPLDRLLEVCEKRFAEG